MLILPLLIVALASGPSCTTTDKRVEALIAAKAKELNGKEYCKFRIYETLADLDSDQIDDFVVVFSVEGIGGGGNNHAQFLAAFTSKSGWASAVAQVGKRGERVVEGIGAEREELVLATKEQQPGDAMCCPSKVGSVRYRLEGGQLRLVPGKEAPSNNGLHQTGRVGAAASRPVVEARPAGEAGCSADLGSGQWLDHSKA